ncbi:uncharacterized protein DNG_07682 [Cephalotrichum gorgonifer]|uniref:Zn(2)-C6 fungal-type domain-containing protein n=1 Tax=Cephalotrichum gorgonifer TaxID=2041049 RepID=A0AAE8SYG3_9PEZI|nr:uncharacterized protein DNG_07682 [Cephalotrichum gorgonifer]
MPSSKVASACARCRKQKLKCDVERPCTMCTRTGVDCVRSQPQPWHNQGLVQSRGKARRTSNSADGAPSPKRVRLASPTEQNEEVGCHYPTRGSTSSPVEHRTSPAEDGRGGTTDKKPWRNSTSTIMLVEEAFHHHDSTSPEMSETSTLGYKSHPRLNVGPQRGSQHPAVLGNFSGRGRAHVSMAMELASLLPNSEAVTILVDIYFEKIHWFMLLFHQREFKTSLDKLFAGGHPVNQMTGQKSDKDVGYLGVLLATCALSLRYVSPSQKIRLMDYGVDPQSQRERILAALRLRLLDILALGSLEAVQICVLLGSYYLYHGEPELAWPLCGCALRLSQALELHRSSTRHTHSPVSQATQFEKSVQARKRCWWAVHEIETFCSMIYGFPLSISDADCDVEPLDPSDPWSIAADGQSSLPDQPTLLVYKCSMSELSKIVKSAIEGLYGSRQDLNRNANGIPTTAETSTRVQALVTKVASLDTQITRWYSQLPGKLRLGKLAVPGPGKSSNHENHRSETHGRAPSTLSFDDQLFQLQALALKLAFENARILIHRPLLSYKLFFSSTSSTDTGASRRDPNLASVSVCRDAALQISCAGNIPIFKEASTTYALNFISLHILTAGVTLCIMAGLSPLSPESLDSKLGVRRLMEMQAYLQLDCLVASQGLEILKKLSYLVMKKETEAMLALGTREHNLDPPSANDTRVDGLASNEGLPDKHSVQPTGHDCPPPTVMPSSTTSSDLATQICEAQGTPLFRDPVSIEISGFCEDLLMTQTMFDVEQAMGYSGHGGLTQPGDMADGINEDTLCYQFIGQDQSWMWDPAIDFGNT